MDNFINVQFIINMTFTFSVTTIIILMVKWIFKNKFTPKWNALIWIVLLVRMIVPTFPESDFSIFNFIPSASEVYTEYSTVNLESGQTIVDQETIDNGGTNYFHMKQQPENIDKDTSNTEEDRSIINKIENSVILFYFIGVLGMLINLILSYRKTIKMLRILPLCKQENILEIFATSVRQVGIAEGKVSLKTGVTSPMLVGICKPTIYISDNYNEEELKYVFTHELYHYKNNDIVWNVISSACLCLNWFNPIAWYAIKHFRRDLEIYCDYRTINLLGRKKDYAEILLKTAMGERGFLIATTCFENGKKEVSTRIKSISNFKKPKILISIGSIAIIMVLVVFCLTDANGSLKSDELVEVLGPYGGSGEYVMEIPEEWNKKNLIIDNERKSRDNISFYNQKGEKLAGLIYKTVDEEDKNVQIENASNMEEAIQDLVLQSDTRNRLNDSVRSYFSIGPTNVHSNYIFEIYESQYFSGVEEGSEEDKGDGKIDGKSLIRTDIYIALDEHATVIPVLYTENPNVSIEELIGVAKTIRKIEEPTEYVPKGKAEMYVDGKNGIGLMGGEFNAKSLLQDYFNNYVATELPLSRAIKSYKINKMEEVGNVGDIPTIIDNGMIKGETVPWHIIYPTAKVYKIEYELVPKDKEKYSDVAGGGFEITNIGNKRYKESYGVFYSYSVDGKEYTAAFLGFLHPSNLAEYGIDYSVMQLIDRWYDTEVWSKVIKNAKVKYVGDPSAVGKLVGLLPLGQYTNGMELQTKEVPYGVTLNYKLGKEQPYDSKQGGVLSAWPENNGDLSGIYSKVNQGELNGYILKKLNYNATKIIVEGIENASSININLASPYLSKDYKVVYSDPYK